MPGAGGRLDQRRNADLLMTPIQEALWILAGAPLAWREEHWLALAEWLREE